MRARVCVRVWMKKSAEIMRVRATMAENHVCVYVCVCPPEPTCSRPIVPIIDALGHDMARPCNRGAMWIIDSIPSNQWSTWPHTLSELKGNHWGLPLAQHFPLRFFHTHFWNLTNVHVSQAVFLFTVVKLNVYHSDTVITGLCCAVLHRNQSPVHS